MTQKVEDPQAIALLQAQATATLMLASQFLGVQPTGTSDEDIAAWMQALTADPLALFGAIRGVERHVKPVTDYLADRASAYRFCGRIVSATFIETSQRWKIEFQKIDPKTGEIIKHAKFGDRDGGSTDRIDDRNAIRAKAAAGIGAYAAANVGKVVFFRKLTDERGFALLLDMWAVDGDSTDDAAAYMAAADDSIIPTADAANALPAPATSAQLTAYGKRLGLSVDTMKGFVSANPAYAKPESGDRDAETLAAMWQTFIGGRFEPTPAAAPSPKGKKAATK